MLSVKGLTHKYQPNHTIRFQDFEISNSESMLILGDSGKGKTTLMHLLCGLLSVQTGEICLNDTDLASLNETKRDRFRGKNIGLVFQSPHLIDSLSVMDNLLLCQYLGGINQDKKLIRQLLEDVGLSNKQHSKIYELSQGQAQRISLIRAVVNHPKLILADEPTSSLDDENAETILNILQSQAKKNDAILIITTHDQRVKDSFQNHYVL